jgi:L-lactate dehydrogenase complex protein LldG
MTAKSDILAAIRHSAPLGTPAPDLDDPWITYADREKQFADVLASIGGTSHFIAVPNALEATIRSLPCFDSQYKNVCTVPGLSLGNVDLASVTVPHELADVELAIMPGEFAVAENGAVWVTDEGVAQRVIYFIAQHLVLVVPRGQLLDNLHQAYQRLTFDGAGYGLFIAGPSKTADIEQSLVIGAHGPRSLTVLFVEESGPT